MTRIGKIARLPNHIRDQLNERLLNNQEAAPLLRWLNRLREVREILQDGFDGAPINKQNLSEWRQGGFREWQLRMDLLEEARAAGDAADQFDEELETSLLAGRMAALLAARYAALLNHWDGEPDPKFEEKVRLLRGLNRDLAQLQKTLAQSHRQNREQVEAELEQRRSEKESMKNRLTAPILAKLEAQAMAAAYGEGERGRIIADFLSRTKYNLPPPEDWQRRLQHARRTCQAAKKEPGEAKPEATEVEPAEETNDVVKPSQAKSSNNETDSNLDKALGEMKGMLSDTEAEEESMS